MASNLAKSESRKRTKDISYEPELGNESSFRKIKVGFKGPEGSKHPQKRKSMSASTARRLLALIRLLVDTDLATKKPVPILNQYMKPMRMVVVLKMVLVT
uniref:Putative ovule protein n=1 Tax=Solanum chacoense TaxID=4108 RepID=A0A0V0HF28_SOLCH